MTEEKNLTQEESLKLITDMINKTKQSMHDTGFLPIMWGAVTATCGILQYLQTKFNFSIGFQIWNLVFLAFIPQIWYTIKENKERGAKTYNDIAMDYAWTAFGISMGLCSFVIAYFVKDYSNIPNIKDHVGDFRLSNHFAGFFLILYAIPTFITGGIMKIKTMVVGSIICWVLAAASVFTNLQEDNLLLGIAGICAWLIPGLVINNQYRKIKKSNV
jgi:hypothetical protein